MGPVITGVFFFINYVWLDWVFIAAHGTFSSCSKWGLLFVVVHRLLIVEAFPVAEHGLYLGTQASVAAVCRLISCGAWT